MKVISISASFIYCRASRHLASYFKLSMANNVYDFIEHRYAMLELLLLDPKLADEEATM